MLKGRLFKNWNWMRLLYLLIGVSALIAAFLVYAWLIGVIGLFMIFMSLFSTGCASGKCSNTNDDSSRID